VGFHQYFLLSWGCKHLFFEVKSKGLESNKLLLKVCWQFLAKQVSSMRRQLVAPHYMHTTNHTGLELMQHDISFGTFQHSVFYHLQCNQHFRFSF
jgi:hypothetical protein